MADLTARQEADAYVLYDSHDPQGWIACETPADLERWR
jgi:hypothetical protein